MKWNIHEWLGVGLILGGLILLSVLLFSGGKLFDVGNAIKVIDNTTTITKDKVTELELQIYGMDRELRYARQLLDSINYDQCQDKKGSDD